MGAFCQIKCAPNQIIINGICGKCALNTQYDSHLQACVCPKGYYMNNYGVCQKSNPQPIDCPEGQYYSSTEGCKPCPAGCAACKNAKTCTKCVQVGFRPQQGACVPHCGDGKIISGEQCDDGNSYSGDGCSSTCIIEPSYSCFEEPSVCSRGAVCGNGKI